MSRYIDADKLKEHYMWWGGGFTANCKDGQKEVKKIFDEIIDLQPAADVRENIKGEWITTYLDHVAMGERPKILYCSICNQCIAYPTNYCPNCGAKMRKGGAE